MKRNNKAQTWSIDLVVGVVIFLLLVVVLYSLLSQDTPEDQKLKEQSEKIITVLDKSNNDTIGVPGIMSGNELDEQAIKDLYSSGNYDEIKADLGIEGDVCIFVVDDTGGIVPFDISGNEKLSFGSLSDSIEIAPGVYCGD